MTTTETPLYDQLVRAHEGTNQRPILVRALNDVSGIEFDRGWSIKFVCGKRRTKNRWEWARGTTIEEAARNALNLRARVNGD